MNTKIVLTTLTLLISSAAHSEGIIDFQIPFGNKIKTEAIEGVVSVDLGFSPKNKIEKEFYGADLHGFSEMPPGSLVSPLQLGHVKLGGSAHGTYNWELNAYFDNNKISYVLSPLVRRLEYITKNYKASPMFQVNMLGWQPDHDASGKIVYANTADAEHAAKAIHYINGENKIGLKHIMMGNEPFESEEYSGLPIPSADEYIEKYIAYAMALREAQEGVSGNPNDIKLWGPELATGWTGWQTNAPKDCIIDYDEVEKVKCSYGDGKFKKFIPYFLSRLTDFEKDTVRNPKSYKMLDYLSFHYYPLFRTEFQDPASIIRDLNGNQNVAGMLESVNIWDSKSYVNLYDGGSPKNFAPMIVEKFKKWRQQYYPEAKISLTEFGIDSVDNINYHPIVRPLYLAEMLARGRSAGLDTIVNSFLQSGDHPSMWSLIEGARKTNLYYVYSMFSHYFLGEIVPSTDSFGDIVNTYSVKTSNGTNVFMINKDIKMHTIDLKFKNNNLLQDVLQYELPAWSITVFMVPTNSKKSITVYQYGAKEMGIAIEPK